MVFAAAYFPFKVCEMGENYKTLKTQMTLASNSS